MSPKLTARQRLKLIERVILGREPVAKVCREAGISRVLFYRWLKRYKQAPGTSEILAPGRRKTAKPPEVPERKLLYPELTPSEKLELIQRVQAGEEVADVCREKGISRTIFYRWQKRYSQAPPEEKLESLEAHKRHIEHYFRQTPEKYEKAVLDLVSQHPEYGVRKLVANLPQVAGVSIVGHHGVQNILRRHNLSLYEQRLAYAQTQVTPAVRVVSIWERFFAKLFVLPFETRAAIVRFAGFTALSAFTTIVILGLSGYLISAFGQAAPVYRPGLFFATIALLVGSLFFIYSMKYYFTLALVLSFSSQTGLNGELKVENGKNGNGGWLRRIFGSALQNGFKAGLPLRSSEGVKGGGLQPSLEHIKLKRYPFVSIHLPFYNEKQVANRILAACTSFEYPNYEVIVCDDSNDETVQILKDWENHPKVKILHRPNREGFKGGALSYALKTMDPRTEFVLVFDADFVPYPDTLTQFLKYFKATGGWSEEKSYQAERIQTMPYDTFSKAEISTELAEVLDHQLSAISQNSNIACVAGYQWHVLNKSENWITRGVRTEYAGSYVIERPGQEILGALKIIHGSVYCIRADVLKHFGWGTSITEDFELTLRIYEKGFKVAYTPYIQAPSECVSTIKRLIRQRMRWAEGHSFNVKKMFLRLLFGSFRRSDLLGGRTSTGKEFIPSPLTLTEKLEFLYISPYYLQAFFFLLGTLSWLISETVFKARLPFWTSLWGWSLVLTNFFALPLMNAVGLFLEEAEEKDYLGLLSFVALCYIMVPFQAYASVKGFLEEKEGPWFRTPKTGLITDIFTRGRFYRLIMGILPGRAQPAAAQTQITNYRLPIFNPYLALATANNRFANFAIHPKRLRWVSKIVLVILLCFTVSLYTLAYNVAVVEATNPSGTFRISNNASTVISSPVSWALIDSEDTNTSSNTSEKYGKNTGNWRFRPGANNSTTQEDPATVGPDYGWVFETSFTSGGQIAAGTWTFTICRVGTDAAGDSGYLRVRVYKVSASGGSITASDQLYDSGTYFNGTDIVSGTTLTNITLTSASIGPFTMDRPYLFIDFFVIVTANDSSATTDKVEFDAGLTSCVPSPRVVTPAVTIPERVIILALTVPFIPLAVSWWLKKRRQLTKE